MYSCLKPCETMTSERFLMACWRRSRESWGGSPPTQRRNCGLLVCRRRAGCWWMVPQRKFCSARHGPSLVQIHMFSSNTATALRHSPDKLLPASCLPCVSCCSLPVKRPAVGFTSGTWFAHWFTHWKHKQCVELIAWRAFAVVLMSRGSRVPQRSDSGQNWGRGRILQVKLQLFFAGLYVACGDESGEGLRLLL